MITFITKKIIPLTLIFSLISSLIFLSERKEVSAQWLVSDPATEIATGLTAAAVGLSNIALGDMILILTGVQPGEAMKEGGLFGVGFDGMAYFAGRILIRQLTQSLVDWINSGFEGNPSFVQDPGQFLEDTADRTIGNFIQDKALGFLCKPFQINIKLSLGLQYSPFKDQIGCRLTDILNNSEDAYNNFVNGDFIGGGGWDSWLSVTTVPQNNQLGAMLIAQGELDARINNQSLLKNGELSWNKGLLSTKKCTRTTTDIDGVTRTEEYTGDSTYQQSNVKKTSKTTEARNGDGVSTDTVTEECKIVTPGSVTSDLLSKTTTLDMDALNVADEINEIVGALANFLITKVMEKGFAAVTSEELSPDNADWRAGITDLQAQQYQAMQSGAATSTTYIPSSGSAYGDTPNQDITNGTVAMEKDELLAIINSDITLEQEYHDTYITIYTNASTTSAVFSNAKACYVTALDTMDLTDNETSSATSSIEIASTTISNMTNTMAFATSTVAVSQSYIVYLNDLVYLTTNASTTADLANVQSSLTWITPYLNTSTTSAAVASSTLTQINSDLQSGEVLLEACEAL
jgi:hypothetical protein